MEGVKRAHPSKVVYDLAYDIGSASIIALVLLITCFEVP
jgi:hypothetical protein